MPHADDDATQGVSGTKPIPGNGESVASGADDKDWLSETEEFSSYAATKGVLPLLPGDDDDEEEEEEALKGDSGHSGGDDDAETLSDEDTRRQNCPVFPRLASFVKHNASLRRPESVAARLQPSRRQRTSATVAALGLNEKKSSPPTQRKRRASESTKKPTAVKKAKVVPKKNVVEPLCKVCFVVVHDAPYPPEAIIECDRDDPPMLKYVCAKIFDKDGKVLKVRNGAEVNLEVSVNGQRSKPFTCRIPFPGGLYYFSNLTYTSETTGFWSMRLSAKWAGVVAKKRKGETITPMTHVCEVHFKGDERLGSDAAAAASEIFSRPSAVQKKRSSSPSPPRTPRSAGEKSNLNASSVPEKTRGNARRFVWSEAQVEACRSAYVKSNGDLGAKQVERLAEKHGLKPTQILQRFAYFKRHGANATPPKEFLHEEIRDSTDLAASTQRSKGRRSRSSFNDKHDENDDDRGERDEKATQKEGDHWFLLDDTLIVGTTLVLFEKAGLLDKVEAALFNRSNR